LSNLSGTSQSSRIVYVVLAVDSEMWGGHEPYLGNTSQNPTMNMCAYALSPPSTVSQVFNDGFRDSHRDSFGNKLKITWFAEMDYLMAQSNFVYGDGSSANVSGYTAIYDILMKNWGAEILKYNDEIEYHHHFMIYDGSWQAYNSGPDSGYPDYQMYAIDHMLIDDGFYPSVFRSGWAIMPPALSNWIEKWIPFDFTPLNGTWYPWNPSGMDRWQTRCYCAIHYEHIDDAFARARDYGAALYAYQCHDRENMTYLFNLIQKGLEEADYNEAAYPGVSFQYCTAKEAMQRILGFNDSTPPKLTVTFNGNTTYTITSNEPLWENHPYVAGKYLDGTYTHLVAIPAGTNTWTLNLNRPVEVLGVAASDLQGNVGTLVTGNRATQLTISMNSSAPLGSRIDIQGVLTDTQGNAISNARIVISYNFDEEDYIPLTSARTNASGKFHVAWIPSATGFFTVQAKWAGNVTYISSSATAQIDVS
jgi:hypothetical protein